MSLKSLISAPSRIFSRYLALKRNCWVPPGHFYSPVVELNNFQSTNNKAWACDSAINGIELNIDTQKELIRAFEAYYSEVPFNTEKTDGQRYFFNNTYYSYSDALILHFFIRHFQPKNIIEVGSGYSSAVMLDTRDVFNLKNNISFIEPYPERLKSLLTKKDYDSVTIHEKFVQDIPLEEFKKLDKGDILLIDSTHISKTNSDVNHILFEILPILKSGVLIHFHDVFAGFEYPESWIKEGRSWNEDYILKAFLMYNNEFKIKIFTHQLHQHYQEVFSNMPLMYKNQGGNIWIEKA